MRARVASQPGRIKPSQIKAGMTIFGALILSVSNNPNVTAYKRDVKWRCGNCGEIHTSSLKTIYGRQSAGYVGCQKCNSSQASGAKKRKRGRQPKDSPLIVHDARGYPWPCLGTLGPRFGDATR